MGEIPRQPTSDKLSFDAGALIRDALDISRITPSQTCSQQSTGVRACSVLHAGSAALPATAAGHSPTHRTKELERFEEHGLPQGGVQAAHAHAHAQPAGETHAMPAHKRSRPALPHPRLLRRCRAEG